MKALTIIALVLLLLPATIMAQPTMGIYFTYTPFNLYYYPTYPGELFDGYVYVHNTDCYLTAAEFQVIIGHPAISVNSFTLLPGWINLGDPVAGISISGWPPLDGWNPGYNLIMTIKFLAIDYCMEFGGGIQDVPITIGPHPETGGVRGTCWPDNNLFPYIGLTAIICPFGTATEDASWGAIKSMLD
jgi:hypothetical protein